MYVKGLGVPQDYKTALKWYRLAAKQSNFYALQNLKYLNEKIAAQKSTPEKLSTTSADTVWTVCARATMSDGSGWEPSYSKFRKFVEEARRRGLTLARCNEITGRGSSGGTRVALRPSSSGSSSSSGVSLEMMKELKRLRRETARLKKVEEEKNDRLRQRIAELEKKEKARLLALEADRRREKERSSQKVSASVIESASGFFVSRFGHVITNEHVVKSCRKVTVGNSPRTQVVAKVIEMDGRNDLALLKVASLKTASVETKSLIQKLSIRTVPLASGGLLRSDEVALGEDVLVAGYPYGDLSLVGEGIKVTKGIISAKRGLGGDVGQL